MITGEHGTFGYAVLHNGEQIYQAGNSPHDSHQCVEADAGLSLATLRQYCLDTMVEMAGELDDDIGNCILVD